MSKVRKQDAIFTFYILHFYIALQIYTSLDVWDLFILKGTDPI